MMNQHNYQRHLESFMSSEDALKVMDVITIDDLNAPYAADLEVWEHPEYGVMVDFIDKMDQIVTRVAVSEL